MSNAAVNFLRGSPGQGEAWTWAGKAALRRIRESLDGHSLTAYVLTTYHALCENSSDLGGQNPFQTSQPHLARLAGCSVRQMQKALKILQELGLIEIHTPALRGPCTYSLRTIDGTLCSVDATLRRNGNHRAVRTTEERREKDKEEKQRESNFSYLKAPRRPQTVDEVIAYGRSPHCGLNTEACTAFWDHYEANGWTINGVPIADWKAAARKWKNNEGKHGHIPTRKTPDQRSTKTAALDREGISSPTLRPDGT